MTIIISKYIVKNIMQLGCIVLMIEGVLAVYDYIMMLWGIILFICTEILYRYDRQRFISKENYR